MTPREPSGPAAGSVRGRASQRRGERQRHRAELERAIAGGERLLANQGADAETVAGVRWTLLRAYAARAEDARHGANQLMQSAQRAPTRADCEDGWVRVEEIVNVAEASAVRAGALADEIGELEAREIAEWAGRAARAARRFVDERNHAYTFHADPGFSFGEGWYLAAAAVLDAQITIQIEPARPQSAQADRFLSAAGLGSRLVPYRPRPRANKHLPAIVADAFRADSGGAQRRLRAAFLGDGPIPQAIVDWSGRALGAAPAGMKILLWVRYATHHPTRNTTHTELVELARRSQQAGLVPVLVGDALEEGAPPEGVVDLTLFWKQPLFQGLDMRRAQLQLFEHLKDAHGLVGQLGVTTAGMDGPALLGLPTLYLTEAPNVRLGSWVGAVPGYEEVVRSAGYLDRISRTLERWQSRAGGPGSSSWRQQTPSGRS